MFDSFTVGNNNKAENSSNTKPRQEIAETSIEVICDICPGPNIEYDKPSILSSLGWQWGSHGTFCPGHN